MQHEGDILVVDDEPTIAEFIIEALTDEGYVVRTALTAADARAAIAERHPDLVLLDLHMPEMSGFDVQRALAKGHATVPVVVITGHSDIKTAVEARKSSQAEKTTRSAISTDASGSTHLHPSVHMRTPAATATPASTPSSWEAAAMAARSSS